LEERRTTRDGPLWSEADCFEIKQPDFPFLVPLAAAQSHSGDEESKGDTSLGYALALSEIDVILGTSPESPLEISFPHANSQRSKVGHEYFYYLHHLVVCLFLCCVSVILLLVLLTRDWESAPSDRRGLSIVEHHYSPHKRLTILSDDLIYVISSAGDGIPATSNGIGTNTRFFDPLESVSPQMAASLWSLIRITI
jgi:hypothetical protein